MLIVGCTLLGLLTAAAGSLLVRPTYAAQTQLFVAIQSAGSVAELQQGNTFTQARVLSYVETTKTPAVLQPVIDSLGLAETPAELASRVSAGADLNTVIVTISASDDSPVQAAAIAQAVADSLISLVGDLERPDSGAPSPVKLSIVTPAVAPTSPSSPNTELNMVVGLLGGLTLGLAISILRAAVDTKVRGEPDFTRISKAPLLGWVSYDEAASSKPLLTQASPQSPRAESFRQIRTNLQFAAVNSKSKTVLVTSSVPGEGKSTTATNLAIAMAQAGQRVVLIEADLRRPMVANYLGLEGSAGLTTALVGGAALEDLLQPWGADRLHVLSAGRVPPNPSELLGSTAMAELLHELESMFDAVIIDAPPLIPVTDAAVLAQVVGGVVLVVGAGKIKTQDLEKSLASLSLVDANLLGVVLNFLPTKGPDAYAYDYYSYESSATQSGRRSHGTPANSLNGSHMRTARRARNTRTNADVTAGRR